MEKMSEHSKEEWPVIKCVSFWEKYCPLMSFSDFRRLTPKEIGQIKKLRERVGVETVHVMAWTLDNWFQYAKQVQEIEHLAEIPAQPQIGFLLKYWVIAVGMLHLRQPQLIAKCMDRLQKSDSTAA